MIARVLPLLGLIAAAPAAAQPSHDHPNTSGGPLDPEQARYDVTYYDLDLTVEPALRLISGTLAAHGTATSPLETVVLDLAPTYEVAAARTMGEEPADFVQAGGRIRVDLGRTLQPGEPFAVSVDYAGAPRVAENAPWDGGFVWAESESGEPWVGVAVQGEGADLWWPAKDHPSDEPDSMRIALTVPGGLVAASNGRLRSTTPASDDRTTYEWFVSTPINNYGVTLNIGPYRVLGAPYTSTAGVNMPITFYVLPEKADAAEALLPQIADHLNFFERHFGPYPWRADKYAVAHAPYLGMEHQTLIAYGSTFDDGDRGYDWLHHHELAHEWWGNLVTAADWRDFWIHEGFAIYAEAMYAEELYGPEAYRANLQRIRPYLLNQKPVAPLESRTTDQMYFAEDGQSDGDIYYKGGWVLHTLRWAAGDDEAFFRALRRFAYPTEAMEATDDGSAARFVSTEDFRRTYERETGVDARALFAVYLRQPELPTLTAERGDDGLTLYWNVPKGALPTGLTFDLPVEVAITDASGQERRVRVPMTGGAGSVPLAPGDQFTIDPDAWLLVE
jgi:aminopeptidase N